MNKKVRYIGPGKRIKLCYTHAGYRYKLQIKVKCLWFWIWEDVADTFPEWHKSFESLKEWLEEIYRYNSEKKISVDKSLNFYE